MKVRPQHSGILSNQRLGEGIEVSWNSRAMVQDGQVVNPSAVEDASIDQEVRPCLSREAH